MMTLENRKLQFIESFLKISDENTVNKLEKNVKLDLAKGKKEDFKPMSLESFYEMIDISHQQHLNGEVYSEEEVDKLIDSWK